MLTADKRADRTWDVTLSIQGETTLSR